MKPLPDEAALTVSRKPQYETVLFQGRMIFTVCPLSSFCSDGCPPPL